MFVHVYTTMFMLRDVYCFTSGSILDVIYVLTGSMVSV